MRQPETSDIGRAYGRAEADVGRAGVDPQADLIRLIHQIGNVDQRQRTEDGAGAKYLIVQGAHNADFRIAICVATDGKVGWSLV